MLVNQIKIIALFFLSAFAITLYLMEKDPKLLERRVYAGPTAEKETSQKIIQFITSIGFMAMLVVPALDRRFAWPTVPLYASVVSDVLVAIGFLIIFFVYKENTFTSATIEVYPEQKVISTSITHRGQTCCRTHTRPRRPMVGCQGRLDATKIVQGHFESP